ARIGQHGQGVEEHRGQQEMVAELGQPDVDRHEPHSLSSGDEGRSGDAEASDGAGEPDDARPPAAGTVPVGTAKAADRSFESPSNSAPSVSDDSVRARPPNSTVAPPPGPGTARTNTRRRRTRNDTSSPASAAMAARRAGNCPGS